MNRAYSMLQIKAIDEGRRMFSGIATTPTPDRIGDSIDPAGVKFAADLPLLWQHKHDAPIGRVRFDKPSAAGIAFEAQIPVVHEPGPLQDRVNTAWGEIKYGLVRATSIGFMPTAQPTFNKNGGLDFPEIEVYELSAVTIPMNAEALITEVKSIDAALRKAAGIVDDTIAIAGFTGPEIITPILSPPEPAALGKSAPVVRLNAPPASRPFVLTRIHPRREP